MIHLEGIVLHSFDFKEYDKILTVLSKDEGMVKLILKGANRFKQGQGGAIVPLCTAEFSYKTTNSDLYVCSEAYALKSRQEINQSLAHMEAAFDMVRAVRTSQLFFTPIPALYHLLEAYLDAFPRIQEPATLSASFKLKLLKHDGLLKISEEHKEPLPTALLFSPEDFKMLYLLSNCRQFQQLADLRLSKELQEKIALLFRDLHALL